MNERTRVLYLWGNKRVFTGEPGKPLNFFDPDPFSRQQCEEYVSAHEGELSIEVIPHIMLSAVYRKIWFKVAESSDLFRIQNLAAQLPEGSTFLIVDKHSPAEEALLSRIG